MVTRRLAPILLALSCLVPVSLFANTPPAPEGHAIGSAGFNELLGKQIQPGTFSTQRQADGTFVLTNTMQTVSAHIAPQGVAFDSIGNSAGKGGFSLQLSQWGREGALQPAASSKIYSESDAVYHTHTNGIAEKFSNTSDGIRQDFIIPVKPEGNGDLQVQLHVSGATLEQKNDGAVIALHSGRRLTYNKLKVTDSNNQMIPAQMVVANNTITLAVNDSTAQYPLTIDPTVGDENWVSMGSLNGTNGRVQAILYHGGTLYIGGVFTVVGDVNAKNIVKWNGNRWSALGSGTNNDVNALAVDGSGNLYVGGHFTVAGGVSANRIAKWNGSIWSALGSGFSEGNPVYALVVDSSGNLYVGGNIYSAGGVQAQGVAKWNGSKWSSLAYGITCHVSALALDGSGNLYAGGSSTGAAGNNLYKWNGSSWSLIGSGMDGMVSALAVNGSGSLYVGGNFTTVGGIPANRIAKWNGSSWSALGSGFSTAYSVEALAVDTGGNVYLGGSFTTAGGVSANHIAKWNGNSWSALGSGTNNDVNALAVDGSGNLYVGGHFTVAGGVAAMDIAKWDGSSWSALGSGTNSYVNALVRDGSGNLYAGGHFTTLEGVSANRVAKWNGSSWSALGSGISAPGSGSDANVFALALDGSGNLYAGGFFTTAGGVAANNIAKWDGSSWSALGSGMNASVNTLIVDGSGNLYAGGGFTTANGVSASKIAKWNGSNWSALGSGMNGTVITLALDGGGNLYAGGGFTTAGGISANYIAKWNGSAWSTLGSGLYYTAGLPGTVYVILVDGNTLYVGGEFIKAGEKTAYRIAKWNGSDWSKLGSGMNGGVFALALDGSGNLYAGGTFTTAGGISANYIAKWNGSSWSALGSGLDSSVTDFAMDGSGNLYVGGGFNTAGGQVSSSLAKWVGVDNDGDGVPDVDDAFPLDPAEWLDTDADGTGNNADSDDDNDHRKDFADCAPLDPYLDCSFRGNGKSRNPQHSPQDKVVDVDVQADGKLLVAGAINNASQEDMALLRLNADGTRDTSFGVDGTVATAVSAADDIASSVLAKTDGSILVSGSTIVGDQQQFVLARYDSNGNLDTSFAGSGIVVTAVGAHGAAESMTEQADGRIVVAGVTYSSSDSKTDSDFAVVRYLPSGALDSSFAMNGKQITPIGSAEDKVTAVIEQADGKLVAAGNSKQGQDCHVALVRYTSGGNLDTGFGSGGIVTTDVGMVGEHEVSALQQSDGKLVVATTGTLGDATTIAVARYSQNGSLDTSFGNQGMVITSVGQSTVEVSSVEQQADGKLLVVSSSNRGSSDLKQKNKITIVRYTINGQLDNNFGLQGTVATDVSSTNDYAYAAVTQADGYLVVAGTAENSADMMLVRYELADADSDGFGDTTDAFPNDPAESVDTDSDGTGNNADTDDDNDGIPDSVDAEPLNAAVGMNLNGVYKGSTINDSAAPF